MSYQRGDGSGFYFLRIWLLRMAVVVWRSVYIVCKLLEIAQPDVQESRLDENGSHWYDGVIIWMRGGAYLVDCNVNGLDEGIPNNPKVSFRHSFVTMYSQRLLNWLLPMEYIMATYLSFKVTMRDLMLISTHLLKAFVKERDGSGKRRHRKWDISMILTLPCFQWCQSVLAHSWRCI